MYINPYLYVFFLSMLPILELRGAIPYGFLMHLNPILVFLVAVAGNMVPIPFILLFLRDIEKYLRRWEKIARLMDWFFDRTYKKADKKIRKWEYIGLILYVSVPLPITGAWTASLIAYLFKMRIKKAILAIFIGTTIAGAIVTLSLYYGFYIIK